jgi:hypothetical protein
VNLTIKGFCKRTGIVMQIGIWLMRHNVLLDWEDETWLLKTFEGMLKMEMLNKR